MMTEESHLISTPDGEPFEIPVQGSLGLLALGDLGVIAWRNKIDQVKREMAARGLAPTAGADGSESEQEASSD